VKYAFTIKHTFSFYGTDETRENSGEAANCSLFACVWNICTMQISTLQKKLFLNANPHTAKEILESRRINAF